MEDGPVGRQTVSGWCTGLSFPGLSNPHEFSVQWQKRVTGNPEEYPQNPNYTLYITVLALLLEKVKVNDFLSFGN